MRSLSPATLAARRDTYAGFDDGLTMALELAVTPVVFGLAGYGLDRWLGILPAFTIVFVLLAVVGLSLRMWYGYEARMKEHEAAGPWARRPERQDGARRPERQDGARRPETREGDPAAATPSTSPNLIEVLRRLEEAG